VLLLAPHHENILGSGGITTSILDFNTRWRQVVSVMTQLLYARGKSPQYTLDRSLGGPQSWSVCSGEEKNS